jgi:hypothetical protein
MDESLKAWLRTSPKAASAFDLMCMAWEASAKLEREAIASMFDDSPNAEMFRQDIAAAIRARSQEGQG